MVEDRNKDIGIYQIKNIKNGRVYIGSSLKIEKRIRIHKDDLRKNTSHSNKLQRAWNKYGENNFKFTILEYCKKEQLLDKEEIYIRKYDSVENGYNACYRGRSALGVKRSKEFKEKCSISQKKVAKRPSESKRRSEQVKRSFAEGNRKPMTLSKSERKRRSEFAKTIEHSEKERNAASKRLKKLRKTRKFNDALNIWNKSEEKNSMMSSTMKEYWADPKWRERQLQKLNKKRKSS